MVYEKGVGREDDIVTGEDGVPTAVGQGQGLVENFADIGGVTILVDLLQADDVGLNGLDDALEGFSFVVFSPSMVVWVVVWEDGVPVDIVVEDADMVGGFFVEEGSGGGGGDLGVGRG